MKLIQTFKYIFNAYIALFLYPFSKKKRNIWIIGGHHGELYTDNAKVFYEYILRERQEIKIYWMVNKNAPAMKEIKGQYIIKGSIQGYLIFYQAKVSLFSNTFNSDIAPYAFLLPLIRSFYNKQFKVYLGHGTISFKKMPVFSGFKGKIKRNIFKSYNLAIAATELEKSVMEKQYGIKESDIVLAGSARHDKLENIYTKHETILIAPTWRTWLKGRKSLKNSFYFQHYKKLLTDNKLLNFLKKNNIIVKFYLHHMLHEYLDDFVSLQNSNVKILPKNADISYEIQTSRMLITDYSSISSDFYYLKKPVLFYQFDQDEYIAKMGSEIDIKKDIFGLISYSHYEIINSIKDAVESKYSLHKKQIAGEKYFIQYNDKKNCQRIYSVIFGKLGKY